MRVSRFGSRAIGFGLVFAAAGFTFAVATGGANSSPSSIASRAIGSNVSLKLKTPNLLGTTGAVLNAQEYDLGDALFGSSIVRYILAEGGVKPYRFTTIDSPLPAPIVPSLPNATANTTSTLKLGASGALSGVTPASIAANSKTFTGAPGLRFFVKLTDANESNAIAGIAAYSAPQTGNFNLALFNKAGTPFRFAVDTLPAAQLDAPYVAKLDVLGGKAPVVISALSVTLQGNPTPVKLTDLGLFLASDGTLYGRPIKLGTYTITAHAVDFSNAIATSRRSALTQDQVFTLVINDLRVTTGDTMIQQCVVTGDTSTTGQDSLVLKGLINTLGLDQKSLLNSEFSFQLGNIAISGRLDKNGNLIQRSSTNFNVKINASAGTISISAIHGTFVNGLDLTGIKTGDSVLRPVKIVLGNAVLSCEVLQFVAIVSGTSYVLDFTQGQSGVNATGGFQIVKVRARDTVTLTGLPGDAWHVEFVAQPRATDIVAHPMGLREGIDNINTINIRVGAGFSQSFTGLGVTGAGPAIKITGGPIDGIQSFKFDTTSGKGSVDTRALASKTTGIPVAADSLKYNAIFFSLGLDVFRGLQTSPGVFSEATYVGEHARRIFGVGKTYTDVPAGRNVPPIF